jgi:sugar phosphate isomerase/epimerase
MSHFKYAYNSLVYFGEGIEQSIERVARYGYDAIELVGEPTEYDAGRVSGLARDAGIAISSICSIYTADRDLAHPDAAMRQQAIHYVRSVADFAAEVGAPTMIIAPTACMKTQRLAPELDEWKWAVEGIREGGDYAASVGIDLTLECWNRYETYFLNRLEQALKMWRDTGLTNGGVMGDTFHMNIEEASIPDAIRSAGSLLNHVHIADSNRAAPGQGHTDFLPILQALVDVNYSGYLSFELLPAAADPFGTMRAGGGREFFDPYTEQAITRIKALEAELAAVAS